MQDAAREVMQKEARRIVKLYKIQTEANMLSFVLYRMAIIHDGEKQERLERLAQKAFARYQRRVRAYQQALANSISDVGV